MIFINWKGLLLDDYLVKLNNNVINVVICVLIDVCILNELWFYRNVKSCVLYGYLLFFVIFLVI